MNGRSIKEFILCIYSDVLCAYKEKFIGYQTLWRVALAKKSSMIMHIIWNIEDHGVCKGKKSQTIVLIKSNRNKLFDV